MKTVCIYHSQDLDGWMSAAIVKHYHLTHLYNEPSTMDFIGYNYGQPIPDLLEYDKVIMCDISFPKETMELKFTSMLHNFVWIDHHISAINESKGLFYSRSEGLRDVKFAACELTWKYFMEGIKANPDKESVENPMPEIVRLLGRYDCFGHKGTDEEKKVLEFQYGARQAISNYEEAYDYLVQTMLDEENGYTFNDDTSNIGHIYNKGVAIYQYLCTEAKQIYDKGFVVTFLNKYQNSGEPDRWYFLCVNRERFNPINFGIDYHKEGYDGFACFHYEKEMFNYSLYNDNGKVDVSIIAKQFGGGGHKGAAGFRTSKIILE